MPDATPGATQYVSVISKLCLPQPMHSLLQYFPRQCCFLLCGDVAIENGLMNAALELLRTQAADTTDDDLLNTAALVINLLVAPDQGVVANLCPLSLPETTLCMILLILTLFI